MSIGGNIKRIRKKRGLTQKELAERLGVTQQNLAQYENSKRFPKSETIAKIASALECSSSDLNDKLFDVDINYKIDYEPIIKNGVLSPNITDIDKMLKDIEELPFTIMTENEKVMVYFNSLNDIGKDKVIEYMELLLSVTKYRNLDVEFYNNSNNQKQEDG